MFPESSDVASAIASDDVLVTRIEGMRLWLLYFALCKEGELQEKVTRDKRKGQAIEHAMRELLDDQKDFLVSNGFMRAEDVGYLAGDVMIAVCRCSNERRGRIGGGNHMFDRTTLRIPSVGCGEIPSKDAVAG